MCSTRCGWQHSCAPSSGFCRKSQLFATVVETQCSPAKAIFLGFNPDAVVHCVLQPLSAPKVLFRRLYAHMAEQKLDLLKFPARDVTEPGTGAAKIMRRQLNYSCFGCALPHHTPDDLLGDSCTPDGSTLIHTAKDSPTGYTGGLHPYVQGRFDPVRHGDCSDMPSFAYQVYNGPVILPSLQVLDRKMRQLRSAKATAEADREDASAALATDRLDVGGAGAQVSRQPTDSCAAFRVAFAIRNIVWPLEFGKNRGGIRRLTDTSALPNLPRRGGRWRRGGRILPSSAARPRDMTPANGYCARATGHGSIRTGLNAYEWSTIMTAR